MSLCLLDTSALLAHYRKEAGSARVQHLVEDDRVELALASVSITEFARRLTDLGAQAEDARRVALEYAALADRVVPVDTAVAVRAFEIGVTATERLPLVDALIAACASTLGATLVHRDPHFRVIAPGLLSSELL